MKYQCQTKIKRPLSEVFQSFRDYSQMPKWENGLSQINHIKGTPNNPGSITNLVFTFGEEDMVMQETIEQINFPSTVTIVYEVPGAWNRCVNRFVDTGNETQWIMESEFRFERENTTPVQEFKKQTSKSMEIFKKYLEAK